MILFTIAIIAWAACGVIAYASTFAYFQGEYPLCAAERKEQDRMFAIESSLFGPVALMAHTARCHWRHGLKWR